MEGVREGFRKILAQSQFMVQCQAIAPVGRDPDPWSFCEVFVRLKEEEDWGLPPGAFMLGLDRCGLLSDLDRWVVREVAAWYGAKRRHGGVGEHVFGINLTPESATHLGFLDYVRGELRKNDVQPESLCFEIDDAIFDASGTELATFITAAKSLGCRIAIDDYSDGKRTQEFFRQMPVDFVKISGRQTRHIHDNSDETKRIEKIQKLCRRMGMRTVAEMVESPECLAKLRELEVDYAQGALIGRTQPIEMLGRPRPEQTPVDHGSKTGALSKVNAL